MIASSKPSFACMAQLIRDGHDAAAESIFRALVAGAVAEAVLASLNGVRSETLEHPAFEDRKLNEPFSLPGGFG